MRNVVIFTDLDGTLLDSAYSFQDALPALELIRKRAIPLVICSSKTRTEIEYYREQLGNGHPFISENGGGIFIPGGYFDFESAGVGGDVVTEGDYHIFRLGARYSELRKAVQTLREKGFLIRGFGDMTVEEVAGITGLTLFEAEMAKKRDFDEPFVFEDGESRSGELFLEIGRMGLHFTQGIFHHILGNSGKGKAVEVLMNLYRKARGSVTSIALGDSPNDFSMLAKADVPILVQRADGRHAAGVDVPNMVLQEGIGPKGWEKAIARILSDIA